MRALLCVRALHHVLTLMVRSRITLAEISMLICGSDDWNRLGLTPMGHMPDPNHILG